MIIIGTFLIWIKKFTLFLLLIKNLLKMKSKIIFYWINRTFDCKLFHIWQLLPRSFFQCSIVFSRTKEKQNNFYRNPFQYGSIILKDFVAGSNFRDAYVDLCHRDCALLEIDRLQAVFHFISRTVSLQPDTREYASCLQACTRVLLHRDKLSSLSRAARARKQVRAKRFCSHLKYGAS